MGYYSSMYFGEDFNIFKRNNCNHCANDMHENGCMLKRLEEKRNITNKYLKMATLSDWFFKLIPFDSSNYDDNSICSMFINKDAIKEEFIKKG